MTSFFDDSTRLADMWKQSRLDAGKSQEFMAKSLGISRATVQAWEVGTSSPSQIKGFQWFKVLGLNPMPYYLMFLYPEYSSQGSHIGFNDKTVTEALITAVQGLSPIQQRKLLFLFVGDHGSSPAGILELMTAHLQAPLRDRINIAQCVSTNYKLAATQGKLSDPNDVQPNINTLDYSIKKGMQAVVEGKEGYTAIFDDNEVNI